MESDRACSAQYGIDQCVKIATLADKIARMLEKHAYPSAAACSLGGIYAGLVEAKNDLDAAAYRANQSKRLRPMGPGNPCQCGCDGTFFCHRGH